MGRRWIERWRVARADRERGAVLVEAAIMIPLVIVLTFGAIEYGFAFNEQGTVRASTRSAARATSAVPLAAPPQFYEAALSTLDTSVTNLVNGKPQFVWIYKAVPDGHGGFEKPPRCATDCQKFEYDEGGKVFERVASSGSPWLPADRDACPGASDRVGVYLEVKHDFLSEVKTVNLASNTIMSLEPSPGDTC